jgi:hypothetical protein
MADRGKGCVVNITSMSALRPLTRIPAYGAAKAAVVNFTKGEVDAPLTSVMGMKRRRLAWCHLPQNVVQFCLK